MWKWIVGAAVALILLVAGAGWYGYHKLTSGGDSATVTIAASPERVFASLADPDSMAIWMGNGVTITASHHGTVAPGDSLLVQRTARGTSAGNRYTWTVGEVYPSHLLVLQMRSDSSGQIFAMRRDSLVAAGDSTKVISTIASPAIDSMRAGRGDTGSKVQGAALDVGSKLMVAAFRLMSEAELKRLKARLEGSPMPAM
ncbi:MAG TPA: SRPBCC family protein [Gemmatimonadales bacterium]|jgi:uncharacterized protein YndB with AHSA1/START domain